MKRVSDLVYGMLFRLFECTVWIEGMLFKEEADLIAGRQEVLVGRSILFLRREDGDKSRGIELPNEYFGMFSHPIAVARIDEVFENYKAVPIKLFDLFGGNHGRRLAQGTTEEWFRALRSLRFALSSFRFALYDGCGHYTEAKNVEPAAGVEPATF